MSNKNGTKIILWLAGIIVTLVLFIGFPALVNAVVENDRSSRSRDTEQIAKHNEDMLAQAKINGKATEALNKNLLEQTAVNGELIGTLRLIQNDLKHVKEDMR